MDINTLYAATDLGAQDQYDTQIIKEVWSNDMSNMNAGEATQACVDVYKAQGMEAESKCYNAGLSCGDDATCNALVVKYSKALVKGYSGDFASFKKKSGVLASIGEIGGGLLRGLLGNKENGVQVGGDGYYPEPPKSRTGLYIGIALVAVIGIGAAIYFARKKK